MDGCSCLTKLFPLKNLSCAFANIADGLGGSSLSLKSTYLRVWRKIEKRKTLCARIFAYLGVGWKDIGKILALNIGQKNRKGPVVNCLLM